MAEMFGVKDNKCFEQINLPVRGMYSFGSTGPIDAGASKTFTLSLVGLTLPSDTNPVISFTQVLLPGDTFNPDIIFYSYLDLTQKTANIICQNNTSAAISGPTIIYAVC